MARGRNKATITPSTAAAMIAGQERKYNYTYPFDLDLRPDSKLHREIGDELLERAIGSQRVMSQRYDSWNAIDNLCRAYVLRKMLLDMNVAVVMRKMQKEGLL